MASSTNPPEDWVIRVRSDEARDEPRSIVQSVDDRWLLAYATAVGEVGSQHVDLARAGGVLAHPVFSVAMEWPLLDGAPPGIETSIETLRRGLHVGHYIEVHSPVRQGRVRTEARLRTAEQRTHAVLIGVEFTSYSADDELLLTSRHDTLFRGARLEGALTAPPLGDSHSHELPIMSPVSTISVDSRNAVIYTECARIWNPIHTDIRVARAAGLPDTVLHGTEVLSRAVSAITQSPFVPRGAQITSLGCRFTSMVFPGATLAISAARVGCGRVAFEVLVSDGGTAISGGELTFAE